MNKLKKFTSIKTIKDIEIKTDIGFVPVKNVMKTVEYDVYEILFNNGVIVNCADNHIFIDINGKELFAKELKTSDVIISETTTINPISIIKLDYKEKMYDLQMEYHHKFFTNGVLSHNTTVASAYILHSTVFKPEYTTAVLANKKSLSMETLAKIKLMYEELPWFLQMGVSEWNKGRIELGNKSKVITAAASASSIRGNSINCVDVDTVITVRNKNTGLIENISISEMEERLGNS